MFDTYETIFAARADAYQAAMRHWPDARDEEFRMMLAPVAPVPGTTWCDVPAGGGYLWRYLADSGVDYWAVDPSADFHRACPHAAGAHRLQAPVEAVPLADGTADVLVSLAGLHHAADLDAVFGEMRRLVASAGRVVLADVAVGLATDTFLNGFVDAHNPMGHEGHFLDATTVPRLAAAGLRTLADEVIDLRWHFATPKDLGAFAILLFGLAEVSPEQVAEAADRILGVEQTPDGVALRWPLRRLVCEPV